MLDEPNAQQPQAWTCAKCGAALPVEAGTGALVTCGYCGTPFRLPTAQPRGGVNISGESVVIGGDVIGGSVVKAEKELGWWDRLRHLFSN